MMTSSEIRSMTWHREQLIAGEGEIVLAVPNLDGVLKKAATSITVEPATRGNARALGKEVIA
jgi:hypothetical protein